MIMQQKYHFAALMQGGLGEQSLSKVLLHRSIGSVIRKESGYLVHATCTQISTNLFKLLEMSALHLVYYSGHSEVKKTQKNQ